VDAAEVAARAIENVATTLVDADMSDIIAGRPGALFRFFCRAGRAAHLQRHPCGSLTLHPDCTAPSPVPTPSLARPTPSLPPAEDEALAALRIISAALGKARLRHLNLSDNALGEKGIRACAAAFSEQVCGPALPAPAGCMPCTTNISMLCDHATPLDSRGSLLALLPPSLSFLLVAGSAGEHRLPERGLLGARLRGR